MKYHSPSKGFIIGAHDLESVCGNLRYGLWSLREAAGKPFGRIKRVLPIGPMTPIDHAEAAFMEIARHLGIDLGAESADDLDLGE